MTTVDKQLEATSERVVEDRDCASQWGNDGLHVLSTPAILGYMEQTCVQALTPVLQDSEMTVGVSVRMSHTAPARRGDTVTYRVRLTRRDREIEVDFSVFDPAGMVISTGTHERRIVDRAKFIRRMTAPAG